MGIKKIILSSRQLQEITGQIDEVDGIYLGSGGYSSADNLGVSPEEKSQDTLEGGEFYTNHNTDDFADAVNYSGFLNRLCLRCSKGEWEKKNLIKEETEHGNSDIKQKDNFGADGQKGETGVSYDAAKQKRYRLNMWKKKLKNGSPMEREEAAQKIKELESDPDITKQIYDLDIAEKNSESIRKGKVERGESVLNVKNGRNANNGEGHSKKNSEFKPIITYQDADGNRIN